MYTIKPLDWKVVPEGYVAENRLADFKVQFRNNQWEAMFFDKDEEESDPIEYFPVLRLAQEWCSDKNHELIEQFLDEIDNRDE
jgi:hypothetical protein